MARLRTDSGIYRYHPIPLYPGRKLIDRNVALDNLRRLLPLLEGAGIRVAPAFGTLLGMVREGDFIAWDEDIDLMMRSEDERKLVNLLPALRDAGFELVRYDKRGVYSVMRSDEYTDLYIMCPTEDPRVRYTIARDFMLEKHLSEVEPFDFKGLTLLRPVDYDGYLRLNYGDWRTPKQYFNYGMSRWQIFRMQFAEWTKTLVPKRWYPALIRRYQRKYLAAFVAQVEKEKML